MKITTKRCIAIVCTALCCLSLFFACGEKPPTQEEIQVEIRQLLDDMDLIMLPDIVNYDANDLARSVLLDDDLLVDEQVLKLYIHIRNYILTDNRITATAEEMLKTYTQYDEEIFNQLRLLRQWYTTANGRTSYSTYKNNFFDIYIYYSRTNMGSDFFDDKEYSALTYEDYLTFEDYIRENPEFVWATGKDYPLMKWLGVPRPDNWYPPQSDSSESASVASESLGE